MGLRAEGFGKGSGSTLKDLSRWWDETLGIMSPILFGVFGVVLIVLALFLADVIAERSDQPQFWRELIDFGRDNFLLLVGLMFLGSFQAYFYRRYHSIFKWINPFVIGVVVVAWAWVLAQVLIIAGRNSEHPGFGDAGELLESLLLVVFVLAVITGYAIVWFGLVSPANWDKPENK